MTDLPADMYAPNQQVVRGDESGPAEEGEGGSAPVEGDGGINPGEDPQPKSEPEDAPKARKAKA